VAANAAHLAHLARLLTGANYPGEGADERS
jgi:hypothetical protein